MLFGEVIAVFSENYTKHKYVVWKKMQLLNVKAGGTYSYY
jgi:hypothetical protein